MGTSLCDVTMTLKRQEKLETSFFLNRIHFLTRKCMFDTYTQKFPQDYTAAYTSYAIAPVFVVCESSLLRSAPETSHTIEVFSKTNNKGADQTAWMRREPV